MNKIQDFANSENDAELGQLAEVRLRRRASKPEVDRRNPPPKARERGDHALPQALIGKIEAIF